MELGGAPGGEGSAEGWEALSELGTSSESGDAWGGLSPVESSGGEVWGGLSSLEDEGDPDEHLVVEEDDLGDVIRRQDEVGDAREGEFGGTVRGQVSGKATRAKMSSLTVQLKRVRDRAFSAAASLDGAGGGGASAWFWRSGRA